MDSDARLIPKIHQNTTQLLMLLDLLEAEEPNPILELAMHLSKLKRSIETLGRQLDGVTDQVLMNAEILPLLERLDAHFSALCDGRHPLTALASDMRLATQQLNRTNEANLKANRELRRSIRIPLFGVGLIGVATLCGIAWLISIASSWEVRTQRLSARQVEVTVPPPEQRTPVPQSIPTSGGRRP